MNSLFKRASLPPRPRVSGLSNTATLRIASKPTISARNRAFVRSICPRSTRPDSAAATYSTNAENRARTAVRICRLACWGRTSALTTPAHSTPSVTSAARVSAERKAPSGCWAAGMPINAAV